MNTLIVGMYLGILSRRLGKCIVVVRKTHSFSHEKKKLPATKLSIGRREKKERKTFFEVEGLSFL